MGYKKTGSLNHSLLKELWGEGGDGEAAAAIEYLENELAKLVVLGMDARESLADGDLQSCCVHLEKFIKECVEWAANDLVGADKG